MKLLNIFHPARNKFLTGQAPSGFTLIEILVVIGVTVMLLSLGLFMSMDMFRGYSARSERNVVVSVLQKARSHAMANLNQSPWGVCMIGSEYVIFRGACAVATGNQSIPASPSASVTGLSSPGIIFTQLSGTTSPATITVSQDIRVATITIHYEGTILW